MSTWVLILHIAHAYASYWESQSMTSVPGFGSFEECSAAGRRAVSELGGAPGYGSGFTRAQFSCARQTKSTP